MVLTIQLPANAPERQSSAKLVKAFEIRNKTCVNLRKQLIEIIGLEDANAMFDEAERDAEVWWRMSRSATILMVNMNSNMTRFHKLPTGSVFRYHGIMMLKKSAFYSATNSHILGRRKPLHVFIWPFSKVELVKK